MIFGKKIYICTIILDRLPLHCFKQIYLIHRWDPTTHSWSELGSYATEVGDTIHSKSLELELSNWMPFIIINKALYSLFLHMF